jgi:hypothetical protein
VCVCVSVGFGEGAAGQQLWASRYPSSSASPGAADVPVGLAASVSHAYAGGTRSLGDGNSVIAVVQHDLASGLMEQDFQWPIDPLSPPVAAKALTHIANSTDSFMQLFITGATPTPENYLRPVTIAVIGNEPGEALELKWSQFDNDSDNHGNDVPVAIVLAATAQSADTVGVLTDTDGLRGRFRVYVHRLSQGQIIGRVDFPMAMWEGLDDIPVGLGMTPTEAWVASTHVNSSGIRSARVYRFDHSGTMLQAPIELVAPSGREYIVRAANFPHFTEITEYVFLVACQDANLAGTSADFLTVQIGFLPGTNTVGVLGAAVEDFDVIDNPTAITAEVYGPQSNPLIPGYIHTHVTGTAQSGVGQQTDLVTVQYGLPDASGVLTWEWNHRVSERLGFDTPNAISFAWNNGPRVLVTGTTEIAPNVFRYLTTVYDGRIDTQGGPRVRLEMVGPQGQETNLDVGRSVYGYPIGGGAVGLMTGSSRHPVNHDDFVTVKFTIP